MNLRPFAVSAAAIAILWACPFDQSLREYLTLRFWSPFTKRPANFEKPNVRRVSRAFAGMGPATSSSPLDQLRILYRGISSPIETPLDIAPFRKALATARSSRSLTPRDREEIDLLDAKIDIRAGAPANPQPLRSAKSKLQNFLARAKTPELISEARGWLAYVHLLLGDDTAAGKIYLDELNRDGSNLSRETLINSLAITYGHNGGPQLVEDLDQYFDTPHHAAFALQILTNPSPKPPRDIPGMNPGPATTKSHYPRLRRLLEQHKSLFSTPEGAGTLTLLAMRTALHAADPSTAARIADATAADAGVRHSTDFLWMHAASLFLTRKYSEAAVPLLALFQLPAALPRHRAAAAQALCGVYMKTGDIPNRLRYALWLDAGIPKSVRYPSDLFDLSIYWAVSGFDVNLLLEIEASTQQLESFARHNPNHPGIAKLRYALAVRLARDNRYTESAALYQSLGVPWRADRMRTLAALHAKSQSSEHAAYALAKFLSENQEKVYFNDRLWDGYQRYALLADADSRLNRAEREAQITAERQLKDDQEERWRAYLLLRPLAENAKDRTLRRNATVLALECLVRISDRFGRTEEIVAAIRSLRATL
jgi:hypothetical protein